MAWYPIYRIPDAPLNAKFLTYHSLAPVRSAATHYGAHCTSSSAGPGAHLGAPRSSGGSVNGGSPHAQQHAQQLCLPLAGLKLIASPGEAWLDPVPGFTPLVSHACSSSSGASSSSAASSGCAGEEAMSPLASGGGAEPVLALPPAPPGSWEGPRGRRERLLELSRGADRMSLREELLPVTNGGVHAGHQKGGPHMQLSGHPGRHDDYTWFLKHETSPFKL